MRREGALKRAEPNAAHHALVRLEELVPKFTLITQNVDGLHRRAGSRTVIELHGDITRVRCSLEGIAAESVGGACSRRRAARCYRMRCRFSGRMWSGSGRALPEKALHRAWGAAYDCDLFLAVGTSNLVEPAACAALAGGGPGCDGGGRQHHDGWPAVGSRDPPPDRAGG